MTLIEAEQDIRAILAAEDEAIAAARAREKQPAPVDGGTVQAPPGTPLADLIGILSDAGKADSTSEGG